MPDEPISTEVPETVTVDTQADKGQIGDLNKEFSDFWQEADAKEPQTTSAPEAPTTGAAQETKETKTETKPPETQTPAKEITDDEIDRIQLPPHVKPEVVDNFRNFKELWKTDRAKIKLESDRAAKLQAELDEARKNAWTPESKADYEHASQIRRRFDFVSDPEFIQRFHAPVRTRFEGIMEEAVAALPDKEAAQAWADHIKANYQPDQLPRDWWLNSVIAKVPNELDRQSLLTSVSDLIKMQKERDSEITRRTSDKSAFDNWLSERSNSTAQRVQEEIMSEIGEQEKRISEVLPLDIEKAKTNEERAAIQAHNERFQKLNTHFMETMKDISSKGPRGWVRAAVEATRAMLLEGEYKNLEAELKSTKAERDQLKADLDKIAGVRRKLSHTTGTPPAPTGGKARSDNGLSIKDLDIRKAFDNYDWGENQ